VILRTRMILLQEHAACSHEVACRKVTHGHSVSSQRGVKQQTDLE
jgi:hypothetical protein